MFKRIFSGAGALALALALAACGASPSTPASEGTGGSGAAASLPTSDAGGLSGTSTSGGTTDTTSTSTSGGTTDTTGTSTSGGTTDTTGTSTSGSTGATSGALEGILGDAASDPRFSTLVGLLAATGLGEQLAQAGPFTIFAPTNEAFTALPAGTLEALAQNPQLLQQILLYHVATGELMAADVGTATSATSLSGETIAISADGGMVMLNDTAQVIETDIALGGNNVLHVIDQVLLPPGVTLP